MPSVSTFIVNKNVNEFVNINTNDYDSFDFTENQEINNTLPLQADTSRSILTPNQNSADQCNGVGMVATMSDRNSNLSTLSGTSNQKERKCADMRLEGFSLDLASSSRVGSDSKSEDSNSNMLTFSQVLEIYKNKDWFLKLSEEKKQETIKQLKKGYEDNYESMNPKILHSCSIYNKSQNKENSQKVYKSVNCIIGLDRSCSASSTASTIMQSTTRLSGANQDSACNAQLDSLSNIHNNNNIKSNNSLNSISNAPFTCFQILSSPPKKKNNDIVGKSNSKSLNPSQSFYSSCTNNTTETVTKYNNTQTQNIPNTQTQTQTQNTQRVCFDNDCFSACRNIVSEMNRNYSGVENYTTLYNSLKQKLSYFNKTSFVNHICQVTNQLNLFQAQLDSYTSQNQRVPEQLMHKINIHVDHNIQQSNFLLAHLNNFLQFFYNFSVCPKIQINNNIHNQFVNQLNSLVQIKQVVPIQQCIKQHIQSLQAFKHEQIN